MIKTWVAAAVGFVACVVGAQERWTYGEAYLWTREAGAGTLSKQGDVYAIDHVGKQDWSLSGFPRIPVEAGDVFEMVCKIKIASDAASSDAETGVILRDKDSEVLTWIYGGAKATGSNDWTAVTSRFIIPRRTASIEPRVIGHGKASIWIEGCGVIRSGTTATRRNPDMASEITIGKADLRVSLDGKTGGFTVRDVRTGRVWSPVDDAGWLVLDLKASDDKRSAILSLLDPETGTEVKAVYTVDERRPEVAVEISSSGPLSKPIDYPLPFASRKGERLIIPMNEGVGLPVDEEHKGLWRLVAYGGHGICMGFFGVVDDKTGDGWMCILETPDDAAMNPRKSEANGLWQVGPSWEASKGTFGYTRKARYVFFDKGGHVALCKRYRDYAKQIGLYKPFTEKVKKNPKIDMLIGAANIWNFDAGKEKLRLVSEMQSLGMNRILWSGGGSAEELAAMNAMTNVLTSRYDIYQDIMDPANFGKIQYKHGDWVTEAFPQDINWAGPNGFWRRGWQIEPKDGGEMIPCAVICDSKAVGYARKRIAEELKTKPYAARFIDTTVAAPWFECYHPDHPMTRTESRRHKMELLSLVSGEFNLVCGSETGHEASVPFCDFFEGMLSLGPYRVEDAGRNMGRVIEDVPDQITRYQVNEAYRLPLWELVYHDCVVAQWYWGDYNNKLPKVWRKRDLFNALYGTPPMYLFGIKQWDEMKDRFAASYNVAEPIARATGYSEMIDHRILTPDRSVQQTVFANGMTVTVNFGGSVYKTDNGRKLKPLGMRVQGSGFRIKEFDNIDNIDNVDNIDTFLEP